MTDLHTPTPTQHATTPAAQADAAPPPFPEDVSVGIVSYNGLNNDKLPRTLQALRNAGCPDAKITVVDVASTDGQAQWLEANWPHVRVIHQSVNIGPSPGRNQLLENCPTPFLLLMDSDAEVLPQTAAVMREVIEEDARIAGVSPVVVYGQDPSTIQYANVGLHFLGEACNPWQGRPAADRGTRRYDVGVAAVCALLLRCDAAVESGLFDPRYFVCKEDGDFIHRVNLAGYRIVEDPRVWVVHNVTPRTDAMFRRQLANGWHLMCKDYQKRTLFLIWPLLALHAMSQFAVLARKGHARAWFGAVKDWLAYLPTLRRDRAKVASMRRRHDTHLLRCDDMLVRSDMQTGVIGKAVGVYNVLVSTYWRGVCIVLRPLNGPARPADPERPPPDYEMTSP